MPLENKSQFFTQQVQDLPSTEGDITSRIPEDLNTAPIPQQSETIKPDTFKEDTQNRFSQLESKFDTLISMIQGNIPQIQSPAAVQPTEPPKPPSLLDMSNEDIQKMDFKEYTGKLIKEVTSGILGEVSPKLEEAKISNEQVKNQQQASNYISSAMEKYPEIKDIRGDLSRILQAFPGITQGAQGNPMEALYFMYKGAKAWKSEKKGVQDAQKNQMTLPPASGGNNPQVTGGTKVLSTEEVLLAEMKKLGL